jgi:hypothetical protein
MPPKSPSRRSEKSTQLKPLRLHHATGRPLLLSEAAARLPIRPTHVTGATNHASHHVPVNAQA